MRVVVLLPIGSSQRTRLEAAAPDAEFAYAGYEDVTSEQLRATDVVVGNLPLERLGEVPNLCFLQLDSAGYERYLESGKLGENTMVANASGCYGQAVSEHMLAMLLAMMKRLPVYRDNQRAHVWRGEGHARTLADSRVLVLGAGDIGTHFATLVSALGAHATGARRHVSEASAPFEEMIALSDVSRVIGTFDVVAAALPSAPETRNFMDERLISSMKDGAYFVNAGRGDLVDQAALVRALKAGRLAGAALDVCVPEPLPADSPLWDVPNLLITPHQAGRFNLPATLDRIVNLAAENLGRLARGEEPVNRVH